MKAIAVLVARLLLIMAFSIGTGLLTGYIWLQILRRINLKSMLVPAPVLKTAA